MDINQLINVVKQKIENNIKVIELEIEGMGRLKINIRDELERTWSRDTRSEHTEKGLEGRFTPQLTGKYAPES